MASRSLRGFLSTRIPRGRFTTADASFERSRDDLADFLQAVPADCRKAGAAEWENGALERFLGGFAAFAGARVVDRDDQGIASRRLFAEIIVAATGYE